ncbi:hypothetical protein P4555_19560 [Peribacillus frigoritolerans]|nr:hypothetical protein [Peribacillus frigoritolerans]
MTEARTPYIPSLFKPKTTLYLFEIKITEWEHVVPLSVAGM